MATADEIIWKIALATDSLIVGIGLFREFALPKLKKKITDHKLRTIEEASSNKKTKRIDLDGRGNWIKVDKKRVEVVDTIKRIPGIKYLHHSKPSGYSGYEEYVIVTDEVGQAIEMYISLDEDYAGMSLDEFLLKTLFEHLTADQCKRVLADESK